MTTNIRNHNGSLKVLILTSIGPVIKMHVVLITRDKDIVHNCVIQDEVSLTVQSIWAHVGVDGSVLFLIVNE